MRTKSNPPDLAYRVIISIYQSLPFEIQIRILPLLNGSAVCNLYRAHLYRGRLVNMKPLLRMIFKHRLDAENAWPALDVSLQTLKNIEFGTDFDSIWTSYKVVTLQTDFAHVGMIKTLFAKMKEKPKELNVKFLTSEEIPDVDTVAQVGQTLNSFNISSLDLDINVTEMTLFPSLRFSGIQQLNLKFYRIYEQTAHEIARVLRNSQTTTLNVSANKIRIEALELLASAINMSQVTTLSLDLKLFWDFDDFWARLIAHFIMNDSKVTSLKLTGIYLEKTGRVIIGNALRRSRVERLELIHCNVKEQFFLTISRFLRYSNLLHLSIKFGRIQGDAVDRFWDALKCTRLNYLQLQYCQLGKQSMEKLPENLKYSQITTLNLQFNTLGDRGASKIASALPGSLVEELNLDRNFIGSNGAIALACYFSRSNLKSLSLRQNNIGDEGATVIAKALRGSKIEKLDLEDNHIGNNTADDWAAALRYSSLRYLNLTANRFGKPAARILINAQKCNQTVELGISFEAKKNVEEGLVEKVKALVKRFQRK